MAPREYCVWNSAEEKALLSGVQRHGLGAWEVIRSDPDFKTVLRYEVGRMLCRQRLRSSAESFHCLQLSSTLLHTYEWRSAACLSPGQKPYLSRA